MWNAVRPMAASLALAAGALAGNIPAAAQAQDASRSVAQASPVPVVTPAPVVTPPAMMSPAPASPSPSSSPSASPSPSPSAPAENTLVTQRVRAAFDAWQRGHVERAAYSPQAGGTYIDAFVKVVAPDLAAVGPAQSIRYRTASLLVGDIFYRYEITATSGSVSVLYALDQQGRTDVIVFTPEIFRPADAEAH